MCFDLQEPALISNMVQIIGTAIVETGQQINGETPEEKNKNLSIYAQLCASDILNNHSHLTVNEIRIAVKNGIRGRYGEYYGINPVSISKFIAGFLQSEERAKAIKEINDMKETKQLSDKCEPTDREKNQQIKKASNQSFAQFKETGKLFDIANNRFLFLRKIGLLVLTDEEKKHLNLKAEMNVMNIEMGKASKTIYSEARKIIKSLKTQDKDFKASLQIERRNLGLKHYFSNLIEFEEELSYIFTERDEELFNNYKS
jgi:hypothetical protein